MIELLAEDETIPSMTTPYKNTRLARQAREKKNRKRSPRKAPAEVEIIQNFVNTRSLEKQTDELSSPRALGAWLSRQPLLAAADQPTEDDLQRALAARDGIRALLRANSGAPINTEMIDRLEEASRGARIEVRFDYDGNFRFEAVSSSFADVLGSLLGMVASARVREDWRRFKVCANSECQAAFWDAKGAGKWCSHRCGDRMRSRAYRQGDKYKAMARFRKGRIRKGR